MWTPCGFQVDTMWLSGGHYMVSNVDTTWFPGGHYMVSTGHHMVCTWTPCGVQETTWKPAQKNSSAWSQLASLLEITMCSTSHVYYTSPNVCDKLQKLGSFNDGIVNASRVTINNQFQMNFSCFSIGSASKVQPLEYNNSLFTLVCVDTLVAE